LRLQSSLGKYEKFSFHLPFSTNFYWSPELLWQAKTSANRTKLTYMLPPVIENLS